MIGYKAFDENLCCKGFQYEIGKIYEIEGKLEMCKNGFHFCKNPIDVYGYYPDKNNKKTRICKVEAIGKIKQEGTKYVTSQIRIIEEISVKELKKKCDSNFNSGNYNSCSYNSGNYNSGAYNSGNYNSGSYNSGLSNSGLHNSGNYNSGSYNCGSYNSGWYNSGSYNSGDYNYGNYNSGFFNTTSPTVRFFNKDSGMSYEDLFRLEINFVDLKQSKEKIKALPGYDAQIFYECTGIDWREDE